jgi:hypothetical protein
LCRGTSWKQLGLFRQHELASNRSGALMLCSSYGDLPSSKTSALLGLSMVLTQSHLPQSVFATLRLSMVLALCSSAPSWHLVLALAPLPLPLALHFCASRLTLGRIDRAEWQSEGDWMGAFVHGGGIMLGRRSIYSAGAELGRLRADNNALVLDK